MAIELGQVRNVIRTTQRFIHGQTEPIIDTHEQLIRIICFDSELVFYDHWLDFKDAWASQGKRSFWFHQYYPKFLEEHSEIIRLEPLSEKENAFFRPQMPLRTCQTDAWHWSTESYENIDEFTQALRAVGVDIDVLRNLPIIDAPAVCLEPRGRTPDTYLPTTVVKADNGKFLTPMELFWKGHNVQSPYETFCVEGAGIYRSGISKKCAAYYIGERIEAGQMAQLRHR